MGKRRRVVGVPADMLVEGGLFGRPTWLTEMLPGYELPACEGMPVVRYKDIPHLKRLSPIERQAVLKVMAVFPGSTIVERRSLRRSRRGWGRFHAPPAPEPDSDS